jgi:hypothetical protein
LHMIETNDLRSHGVHPRAWGDLAVDFRDR